MPYLLYVLSGGDFGGTSRKMGQTIQFNSKMFGTCFWAFVQFFLREQKVVTENGQRMWSQKVVTESGWLCNYLLAVNYNFQFSMHAGVGWLLFFKTTSTQQFKRVRIRCKCTPQAWEAAQKGSTKRKQQALSIKCFWCSVRSGKESCAAPTNAPAAPQRRPWWQHCLTSASQCASDKAATNTAKMSLAPSNGGRKP